MFSYQVDDDLVLRPFEPRDAAVLFALSDRNRDHLRPWLPWIEKTLSVNDTQQFIAAMRAGYGKGTDVAIGIWHQGALAGSIGLHQIDQENKSAEIGYWLSADAQGHGLITRSCRAVIGYAFRDLNLNRIVIKVAPDNLASRAVPERLGFVREGTLRQVAAHYDTFLDLIIYSILAAEWSSTT